MNVNFTAKCKKNNKNAFNVIFETYLVDVYRGLVYSFKLLHSNPQKKFYISIPLCYLVTTVQRTPGSSCDLCYRDSAVKL